LEDILAGMKQRYRELAGCDSDEASDIGIRLRVLAKELHEIEVRMSELRKQVFPQTSTGDYLDRHAACRGLTRKTAAENGGLAAESDDALRERLLTAYQDVSNGANAAYYRGVAMREPGVTAANVIPRARGRGTVDVVIQCAAGTSGNAAAAHLAEVFAREREINVDVGVLAAVMKPVAVTVELAFADEYETAAVTDQCAGRVQAYVGGLGVGEPLYRASLYKLLLETDGMRNVRVAAPAADVIPDAYTALTAGPLTIRAMAVTA
jgi:uncharacterized phage protein gp47/JayE